jgi:Ca-activated chloride channel family protein
MQATYALHPSIVPVKSATAVDVLIAFRAQAPAKASGGRRPLNLSLVIDRSGSMAGKPLKQAIQAAETLVRKLQPSDIVSIVVYDDTIRTIVAPQQVSDPNAICEKIHGVSAGGTTDLHGGWQQGCQHVMARKGEPLIHRVLLLTDGQANAGITDTKKLIDLAREQAKQGIVTTTLGFGGSFNEDLLIGMAEAGSGNFYFIETPEDASQVFQIEGESLAAIAAQDLVVTVKPARGSKAKVRDVLNNYPAQTGDDSTVALMGDVYAGEDKLLALEVEIPAQTKAQQAMPLLEISYTYEPASGGGGQPGEGKLGVALTVGTADEANAARPDATVLSRVSRIRIARAKETAVRQADEGKHAQAATTLRQLAEELRGKGLEEEFDIAEEIAQMEHFAQKLSRQEFDSASRKEMRDQSYQGRTRSRADLSARGVTGGSARDLETTTTVEGGVEMECVREGGKLRMRVLTAGYDPGFNVQFPRSIREEGVHYVVESLQPSRDGTFYRAAGKIRRLVRPGEPDRYAGTGAGRSARSGPPKASKVTARTAADLEATDSVGNGVLVQCVREGSKLRARVVSDGYDPDCNMRFPRDIREEGILFVVDEVIDGPGGTSYIACGKIRRLVQ